MLLKIDVNKDNIIFCKNGRIIVKVDYYAQFANGAHLCTIEGNTMDDFRNPGNEARSSKTVFIGQNGGLSIK